MLPFVVVLALSQDFSLDGFLSTYDVEEQISGGSTNVDVSSSLAETIAGSLVFEGIFGIFGLIAITFIIGIGWSIITILSNGKIKFPMHIIISMIGICITICVGYVILNQIQQDVNVYSYDTHTEYNTNESINIYSNSVLHNTEDIYTDDFNYNKIVYNLNTNYDDLSFVDDSNISIDLNLEDI